MDERLGEHILSKSERKRPVSYTATYKQKSPNSCKNRFNVIKGQGGTTIEYGQLLYAQEIVPFTLHC